MIIENWRIDYNINRPHTTHDDPSPAEFAAEWTINQPQAAIATGPLIGSLQASSAEPRCCFSR